MYLLLSTMTALLECGPIFLGLNRGYTSGQILLLCFAYQFGNLFSVGFTYTLKTMTAICGLSWIFLLCSCLLQSLSWLQHTLLFGGLVLLSVSLQSARNSIKGNISTLSKRLARVAGFLLAPTMRYFPIVLFTFCCSCVLFVLQHKKCENTLTLNHRICFYAMLKVPIYHIMLWHQLHYFIYAYTLILTFRNITGHDTFAMLCFSCSWLTYLMIQPILCTMCPKHVSAHTKIYIFIGHLFLLLILFFLPTATSTLHFFVLWILTGFGGGTVFAITSFCKNSSHYQKDVLNFTENVGHFLGTAIASAFAFLFPDQLNMTPWISAVCVIQVLILTGYYHMKGIHYENTICSNKKLNR